MEKHLLLVSFIYPNKLDWFLNHLQEKFKIDKNTVIIYENIDDKSKIIVTFKIIVPQGERIDIKTLFPNSITVHKKANTLYTINALNKLIEQENKDLVGNIDHKSIKIDWNKYQNKLILLKKQELTILNIKRIFLEK